MKYCEKQRKSNFLCVYLKQNSPVFCGLLILLSLLFLVFIREEETRVGEKNVTTVKEKINSFLTQSGEGFKYLVSNPQQIFCTVSICILSFSTVFIVLTVIIHSNLHMNLSAQYTGILLSSAGIGNILGVFILSKFKNANWIPFLSILMFISGIGVFLISSTNNFWVACLGMLIFDGALSMAFVIHSSVQQAITPTKSQRALPRITT